MSTATASSSNVSISTGIPAIDQCLQSLLDGGLSFTLLSCPFQTPLSFTGNVDVTVAPTGASASFRGRAVLGAPFELATDIEISIDHTGAWMVSLSLPRLTHLTDRVMRAVSDHTARDIYNQTLRPYFELYRDAAIAIASADTEDSQGRTVFAGINAYATFSPFRVEPLRSLADTFREMKLEQLTTTIHFACKRNTPGFAFFLAGLIRCDLAFGTQALVLNELALTIDQSLTDLTTGALCRFTLRLDDEALDLRGGFTVNAQGEARISLSLDAADGAWRNPFGIRGVTIGGFGVEVGAGPVFPWIILGARGRALLGTSERPLADADVGLLLNAASPEQCVVSLRSERGLHLRELARALSPPSADLPMPNVSLSDLLLELSPAGGTIAGQTYDAGLRAGGALDLWGFRAHARGSFDYEGGFSLEGSMDRIDVRVGAVQVLRVTGAEGGDAPTLAVECTPTAQSARASLRVELLRKATATVHADLGDDQLSVKLSADGDHLYAAAEARLTSARLHATGKGSFTYPFKYLGKTYDLAITASIDLTVDTAKATARESITFVARVGSISIPLRVSGGAAPLSSVREASTFFKQTLAAGTSVALDFCKKVSDALAKELFRGAPDIIQAFTRQIGAAIFAGMLQFSGMAMGQIAEWTSQLCSVSPGDAVSYLGLSRDASLQILEDTFDMSKSEAKQALDKAVGGAEDLARDIGRVLGL